MSGPAPSVRRLSEWRAAAAASLAILALSCAGLPRAAVAQSTELTLPEGSVAIRLLDASGQPLQTAELPEKSEEVSVLLQSSVTAPVRVTLRLLTVDVLGLPPGTGFKEVSHRFARAGDSWQATLPLPWNAEIGGYAVEVAAGEDFRTTLPFALVPLHPPALLVEGSDPGRLNVALQALGGHIVRASSVRAHARDAWSADNLLDGFLRIRDEDGSAISAGWQSARDDWPAEIVIGFRNGGAPVVSALVFEPVATRHWLPADFLGAAPRTEIPRFVEILAAETADAGSFQSLGTVRLWNRTAPQLVEIEPRPIRYLMLRVLEGYGDKTAALGELRVLAAADDPVLAGLAPNIALPALGGGLVAFTSQSPDNLASALVDGVVGPGLGWNSDDSELGTAARLPQDLVFGFNGDRIAVIDRIEIDAESSQRYAVGGTASLNWPRLVAIGIALDSPTGPFEEIGRFQLRAEPGPQAIPVGRGARYLRVRVLENHGGKRTTIGEIAVIEAGELGRESVVVGPSDLAWDTLAAQQTSFAALPAGRLEVEPNDSLDTGERLSFGEPVQGSVDPVNDRDTYALTVASGEPQTVTLRFQTDGPPRLALTLTDPAGRLVKRHLPASGSSGALQLTWRLDPGDYRLTVAQPARVTALVWDTSGSMEGRSEALERAVRSYVEALGTNESLLLIRFSTEVESLLEAPGSDGPAMLALLEGKFRPDGGTRLFDALAAATELLHGVDGPGTIIALTDGQDSGSELALAELRRRLAAAGRRLIAVGLGPDLADLGLIGGNTGHGVLRGLAQLTGGRYVIEPASEELPALYAALAAELGGVQRYSLRLDRSDAIGQLAVTSIGETIPSLIGAPAVVLVLDASGSMKRRLDGRPMIETAREVLARFVGAMPDGIEAALWTFGHRIAEGRPGDCTDIEELVALGPLDRKRMLDRLAAVSALGTTPIGETLRRVGAALPAGGGRQLIVLVTDGEEECGGDLTAVARELAARGLELNLNIVGFALDQPEVVAALEEAAAAGRGRFVNASAAAEFEAALAAALAAPFAVLDGSGAVMAEGRVGGAAIELPAGHYALRVATSGAPLMIDAVDVVPGATVQVRLDRQGEEIGVTIAGGE
jgi:uncharacterized protein with von Willebrand factor type A (vWA) domain